MLGKLLALFSAGEKLSVFMNNRKMIGVAAITAGFILISVKCAIVTDNWEDMKSCEREQIQLLSELEGAL